MSTLSATSTAVSRRYASALIDSANEAKALDSVESDFSDLEAMVLGSEEFQAFIASPLHSRDDQKNVLGALADKAKFHDLTKNFLMLLAENRRVPALLAIMQSMKEAISARRGELRASVQVANELSAAEHKALEKALADSMGKAVAIEVETDKSLIGGMVVTIGSRMIDDSVKRKLERLKVAMKSGANQNTNTAKAS